MKYFFITPSTLEELRRTCCNSLTVSSFFNKHGHLLLNKDPRLIFNADETSSICSKKFKALTLNKKNLCTVSVSSIEPHISAVLCYNASGYRLKPFVILPKLKNIPPELLMIDAFYASQSSGWMTTHLFTAFCIYFACIMSQYRLTLPLHLRSEPIILLVDNHSSRVNSQAIEFLVRHNIQLLTFPPHTTHVLQPFDVCVASPLKTKMASYKYIKIVKDTAKELLSGAARARYLTISSLVNSWNSIPQELLIKSFDATGLSPLDQSKALNNPLTNKVVHNPSSGTNTFRIGCSLLTSDEMRIAIYNKVNGLNVNNINQIITPSDGSLYHHVKEIDDAHGFILQRFPPLLVKSFNNTFIDTFYFL